MLQGEDGMEANHPYLTTQKTLYVEISWACHRAYSPRNVPVILAETYH